MASQRYTQKEVYLKQSISESLSVYCDVIQMCSVSVSQVLR